MDSYYRVTIPGHRVKELTTVVNNELVRLTQRYDLFPPESFLNRYSREELSADQELAQLLAVAAKFQNLSDGAYTVQIAPLTLLRKKAIAEQIPPERDQVTTALDQLNLGPNLDLGSLLKGYGVDRVYHLIQETGVRRGLVDIGGTVRVIGTPSIARREWRVAVRNPAGGKPLGYFKLLPGQAIATSGDYERGFDYNGQRYHHLIDPRTGYPASGYRGVSVVASDGLTADILSTLFFITGPEGVMAIEEFVPCRALFVDKNGKVTIYGSLSVAWVEN